MSAATDILRVDTEGLSKLCSRNGLDWLGKELIQNAWDQDVTQVHLTIESVGHGRGRIIVTDDDPEGFLDLSHAYTLFAESNKKGNPLQRGRFNLGEKLVIAYCVETGGSVEILTTTGGFRFSKKDGRQRLRSKTATGSKITAEFRASKTALAEVEASLRTFIRPSGFPTTVNGEELILPIQVGAVTAPLPTVGVNEDGDLFRTTRQTLIEIYEARPGEKPMVYEMGIPVVENATPYHLNVMQKVPLNMERDAVTPGYSRKLCALAMNVTHERLTKEEAAKPWVAEALEADEIEREAVAKILDEKHGKKRVVHDPSNPEASAAAVANGYAVVYGGSHSSAAWGNIRDLTPVRTAPETFKDVGVDFSADGDDISIPEEKWTKEMRVIVAWAKHLHLWRGATPARSIGSWTLGATRRATGAACSC